MEVKRAEPLMIYVCETPLQSIIRDVVSTATLVFLMGAGVLMHSTAMQWFGFVLSALWIIGRVKIASDKARMSPQAAADIIFKKFGVRAHG